MVCFDNTAKSLRSVCLRNSSCWQNSKKIAEFLLRICYTEMKCLSFQEIEENVFQEMYLSCFDIGHSGNSCELYFVSPRWKLKGKKFRNSSRSMKSSPNV